MVLKLAIPDGLFSPTSQTPEPCTADAGGDSNRPLLTRALKSDSESTTVVPSAIVTKSSLSIKLVITVHPSWPLKICLVGWRDVGDHVCNATAVTSTQVNHGLDSTDVNDLHTRRVYPSVTADLINGSSSESTCVPDLVEHRNRCLNSSKPTPNRVQQCVKLTCGYFRDACLPI